MNQYNRTAYDSQALDTSVDAGLRSFMLGVYNKMGLGLVITGALAWIAFSTPAFMNMILTVDPTGQAQLSLFGIMLQFAPLGILLISMFAMRNPSPMGANLLYWAFVATLGLGGSIWFLIYNLGSIAQVFFITAAAFFALSLFGYTTKRNLQPIGTFLIMGVVGLIVASIVNMFMGGALSMIISVIGVGIFGALTAFDTQRLKLQYHELGGDQRAMSVATTFGALSLYINFINMFQFLLMLLGNRE
ncbi:MAG: Bax inhibitor-1/YccA family protein [Alphaproteobacteria bacterium]|nr:Bax inhibitor-1/YccA family protein [Alphaproteobacteria bacterium]